MKRKIVGTIIMLFIVVAFPTQKEVNGNSVDLSDEAILNIEALSSLPFQIGRICYDGCHITDDPNDFCTMCGASRCYDYFLREPIGQTDNCPGGDT